MKNRTKSPARAGSHQAEVAKPYYYRVYLADHDIRAEIALTERAAMMRCTFPSDESGVVIDAFDRGSQIGMLDARTIVGTPRATAAAFLIIPQLLRRALRYAVYCRRADRRSRRVRIRQQPALSRRQQVGDGRTRRGEGALPDPPRPAGLRVSVASSFIARTGRSESQGAGADDFETVKSKAQERWDEVLGRIEVEGGTEEQMRTFYSCLYRSVLFPRKFYEVTASGEIMHYSPYNGEVIPGYMYTDTGFWDTFRSLFPLLNLVYPSVNAEIQQGLANTARESGFLPEWASPGHRAAAWWATTPHRWWPTRSSRRHPEKEWQTLYDAMMHARTNVHPGVSSTGRLGHEYYNRLGYIPYDVKINENVARTLEYAYDDWCISAGGPANWVRRRMPRRLRRLRATTATYSTRRPS